MITRTLNEESDLATLEIQLARLQNRHADLQKKGEEHQSQIRKLFDKSDELIQERYRLLSEKEEYQSKIKSEENGAYKDDWHNRLAPFETSITMIEKKWHEECNITIAALIKEMNDIAGELEKIENEYENTLTIKKKLQEQLKQQEIEKRRVNSFIAPCRNQNDIKLKEEADQLFKLVRSNLNPDSAAFRTIKAIGQGLLEGLTCEDLASICYPALTIEGGRQAIRTELHKYGTEPKQIKQYWGSVAFCKYFLDGVFPVKNTDYDALGNPADGLCARGIPSSQKRKRDDEHDKKQLFAKKIKVASESEAKNRTSKRTSTSTTSKTSLASALFLSEKPVARAGAAFGNPDKPPNGPTNN